MTKRYTAADFANARFAEHPDGRLAHRINHPDGWTWAIEGTSGLRDRVNDYHMASFGWVPVIPARTIHDRDVEALCADTASYERDDYLDGFIRGFQQAGGVILDDPEPTNTDRLKQLIKDYDECDSYISLPEFLDQFGVTAPEDNA